MKEIKKERIKKEDNWKAVFPMLATIPVVGGVMYLAEQWGILQEKDDSTLAGILLFIVAILIFGFFQTIYMGSFKTAFKYVWGLAIFIAVIPIFLLLILGLFTGLGAIASSLASVPIWAIIIIILLIFRR